MTQPNKMPDAELTALRNELMAKPFLTDDLLAVEDAIARRHQALLHVKDTRKPWSGENRAPVKALVVVGAFRYGKTRAVENGISRLKELETPSGPLLPRPLSINAPEHFTIEAFGRSVLGRLKLTPARALGPSMTIERLHSRIIRNKPTLLHIDEAQRMLTPERVAQHRREEEQVKIFGQLRALIDLDEWPLPVVLSGTPELARALERDNLGFFRDVAEIIAIAPMRIGNQTDQNDLEDALAAAAEKVCMTVDIAIDQFYDRLIHAANRARGLAFDICHEAILLAASAGRKSVTVEDFITFYARKAGALRAANPFAAADWQRIDPKVLLAAMSGEKVPRIWEVK